MPTVEVRADSLSVDSSVYVGGRAMPTLINSYRNFIEVHCVPVLSHILDALLSAYTNNSMARQAPITLEKAPALLDNLHVQLI